MTNKQIKLVENYIRLQVKRILNEVEGKERQLMDLNSDLTSLKKQGAEPELLDRYKKRFNTYKIGDLYVIHAGSPGIGKWTYKITKISGGKLFGVELENDVQVPDGDFYE